MTDAEYQCDTSDGGVHTNSGVPNHSFALLVDGGTYNGITVNAIGMLKAAHCYWRAQSVYQTPTTDFADHADALEQSCQDLIGQNLKSLGVTSAPTGLSGQSIAAAYASTLAWLAAAATTAGLSTRSSCGPATRSRRTDRQLVGPLDEGARPILWYDTQGAEPSSAPCALHGVALSIAHSAAIIGEQG